MNNKYTAQWRDHNKKAKEAVNEINLLAYLVHIKEYCENLICILNNFDCSRYTIYFVHAILSYINLKKDPVNITTYIGSRLRENDITQISRLTDDGISQTFYSGNVCQHQFLLNEAFPCWINYWQKTEILIRILFLIIFCYFNSEVKQNQIHVENINYDDDD